MIYKNNLYEELKEYVKVNMGFGSDLLKTDLYKRYIKDLEFIKDNFENKRVRVVGVGGNEFFKGVSEKKGKIKIELDKHNKIQIKFYEGRKRTKFSYLDLGLYEDFYVVIIIKEIEVLK